MRRRSIFTIAVWVMLVMTAGPASAGGSPLELARRDGRPVDLRAPAWGWAPIGSRVVFRSAFCDGQQADPAEGPWFARMRADGGGPVFRLGAVSIQASTGSGCPYVATLTFRVPEVTHGEYWIEVCDSGCTTGVGDLMGGMLIVAGSRQEAAVIGRLDAILLRYERLNQRYRAYLAEMRAEHDRMTELEEARHRLESQRDAALAQRERATAAADDARADARDWRLATYAAFALLLAAGMVAMVRRRGTIRIRIPDSPDELLEDAQDRPRGPGRT